MGVDCLKTVCRMEAAVERPRMANSAYLTGDSYSMSGAIGYLRKFNGVRLTTDPIDSHLDKCK